METKEAILSRKSIRSFRNDPVPEELIRKIMETALWAPSWGNTQPWHFTVVSGKILSNIKERSVQLLQDNMPTCPEYEMPEHFIEDQGLRYKELGKRLFGALGIQREDKEKRRQHLMNMTRCFGAPTMIYLHLDKGFNPYALMDLGIIMQTIALLAVDEGLGTVFLARSVRYPNAVREYAPIPGDHVLIIGMAIGYPDEDHLANKFRSFRGEPKEFVKYIE